MQTDFWLIGAIRAVAWRNPRVVFSSSVLTMIGCVVVIPTVTVVSSLGSAGLILTPLWGFLVLTILENNLYKGANRPWQLFAGQHVAVNPREQLQAQEWCREYVFELFWVCLPNGAGMVFLLKRDAMMFRLSCSG